MSNVFAMTGTLGRDAEVTYTPNSTAILSMAIACNTGYGDRQKTMWIRGQIFGKRAEGQLKDYLKKGQQVFVTGELSINEYTGKDGTNKYTVELNVNQCDLVGKKSDQSYQQPATAPAPVTRPAPPAQPTQFSDAYDDDIPF